MNLWQLVGEWWHGPQGERVRAIGGAGGGKDPKIKGSPSTTVEQSGDPALASMNEYMVPQLQTAGRKYGGLMGLTSAKPYMYTDYGKAGGPESQALGAIGDFHRGPTENPYELQGLQTMREASDPEMQLAAGRDYLERLAIPGLNNYYTSIGQGRSGAVGEGISNAAAGMALPILQQSAQNRMQLGGTQLGYGGQQRGRQQENLGQLYALAAMPRMEDAAAKSFGRDAILNSLLRFPVASGEGTSTTEQFIPKVSGGKPPIWQQVMGGLNSVVGIAGAAAMMCWVAAALYGETNPRKFFVCFHQINFGKPSLLGRVGRMLYRRYGQTWAKNRLACMLLRPIFDRVARIGARNLGVVI